jgi:hypothetical protein
LTVREASILIGQVPTGLRSLKVRSLAMIYEADIDNELPLMDDLPTTSNCIFLKFSLNRKISAFW